MASQPQTTATVAPPRAQYLLRARCPRFPPCTCRDFARSSTQVSRSALEFPRRRWSLARTDPLSNLAARPRIDPRGPGARRSSTTPGPRAQRRAPPLAINAGDLALQLRPLQALGKHPKSYRLPCARSRRPWHALGAQASRSGELRGRRAALAVEEPVPSPAPPVRARQWTTHATAVLHGQTPAQISPRSAGSFNAGEAPPRRTELRRVPPPPARPNALSRTISNGRPRLDRALIRS